MDHKIVFSAFVCLLSAFAESLTTESKLNQRNRVSSHNDMTSGWPFSEPSYNSTVSFLLYTKKAINSPDELWEGDETALKNSDFSSSRKTVLIIHGFHSESKAYGTQEIKNALLKFEDVNVIATDWSYYTRNPNFPWVVSCSKGVGIFVSQFVNFLIDQTGISPDQLHLIGHSIGAHVAGFAAKELKAQRRTVARVTGLDPAWPGFLNSGPDQRLAKTDATFVDCIHTCGGVLGYAIPICQADFYPNGGVHTQPGCPWFDLGVCSHGRSFDYFAESINPRHLFEAETCKSIVAGVPYNCNDQGAIMGYPATNKFLGEFYLTTRNVKPFSLKITPIE